MSRLSREKKREQKRAGRPAAVVAPLDVRVPGGGPATIGGVPVVPAEGQEIQHAVLRHLHLIARATAQPVLATVHDERIGYVVPLRVEPDGSSHFTGEPLRVAPPRDSTATAPRTPQGPQAPQVPQNPPAPHASRPPQAPPTPPAPPVPTEEPPAAPRRDKATHFLRRVPEPVKETAPTFPLRAVPEPQSEPVPQDAPAAVWEPDDDPVPTAAFRAVPEPAEDGTPYPGTVTAPTGVFGPAPTMDEQPAPEPDAARDQAPQPIPVREQAPQPISVREQAPQPIPVRDQAPQPIPVPEPDSDSDPVPAAALYTDPVPDAVPDPDPKPTPARGFDAVAEAVLEDDPRGATGDGGAPALLGEPMAQINEAVRAGRIDRAAALAERTVMETSGTLGPEHPEVLKLRELTAYIAYLSGDPLRSFHLSLDLARIRRRTRDAEGAYGNVQSAAAAWRAVRDPLQGLNLGTELLGLWTELTTEEGPAADDIEQLESARARMTRLAERAERAADAGGPPRS
ncbi:tetratricopeptide repeat protein [Streptomyces sp. A012304]|uniref:tetratricopeptide repeat protein n=1 Tax=Streptomyces sp. A012304 TaxID=375446 RepID=UPI002230A4F9|nr:tetratricopeptide repeat protein [Streptomyces sp. A012304]GKQ35102.1 hypothetical protein ALMP_16480 [Streptomyces sp. A012304]